MRNAHTVACLSLLAGFMAWQPIQTHATDSATASVAGSSTASHGSVEGIDLSLAGSVTALDSLAHASADMTRASLQAMEASANLAAELAIASVRLVEDVAFISFTASGAGVGAAVGSATHVFSFTVEMSRTALEASLAGSVAALHAMVDATEVAVVAVALTAGSAGRVIGYRIALAEAPDTIVCIIFNDVGRQLYAAQLR